jgi:hypothetical protein
MPSRNPAAKMRIGVRIGGKGSGGVVASLAGGAASRFHEFPMVHTFQLIVKTPYSYYD